MKTTLMKPTPIQNSGQIDLDRHSVIEASAGTGKTFTIEHLVVDLLKKGKVTSLDEILAVTYTEKAAGELRDRIRTNITKSLEQERSDFLQMALDTFDSASIFTIHGFCNRILQEYAFENGGQFQYELIDDTEVYRKVLTMIMRDIWPERYGDRLKSILEISQFPGTTGDGISHWIKQVIDVAMRFQPAGNDVLDPPDGMDIQLQLTEMETAVHSILDALLQVVGAIDMSDMAQSELCARYASLNIRQNSIQKRIRILSSLLQLLAAHRKTPVTLRQLTEFLSGKDVASIEFSELNTGWKKTGEDYEEKLPRLPDIIGLLEGLTLLDLSALRNMLTANTVRELKRYANEYKESEGLISYDDMVIRVHTALAADAGMLKHVLQRRYRYALVDEFQDTDILQWKIFSMIFLESGANRLFIVGDPKQAIYAFRGADIHAYYTARDEMISRYKANYYCLNENWRSSPALIHGYNTLFADGNWFSDSAIHYLPSRYPAEKKPDACPGAASLILVQCGVSSGSEAKFINADFIARELTAIIKEDPATALKDIAVLVTRWKEAEAIEKSLKRADIKYSYYKKEGLYQSRESLEVSYLLSAIARPHDLAARKRALVTRFFNIPLSSLDHYDAIVADHPISLLFEHWIAFASMKKWPRLFQSLLDDTGILYRLAPHDYDRTVINYRSILQNLEIESFRNNFCIREISDYLNGLRTRNSYSHDSYNIQKIDIDKPGVQILTVHASKGLEFNTVFIAGGFTRGKSPDYWTYHMDGKKTFDLVMAPQHRERYDTEVSGEEERLFYVALTRARSRLYIPLFEPTPRALGSSGILGTRLPNALNALQDDEQVTRIDCGSPRYETAPATPIAAPIEPFILPEPLLPDPALHFLDRTMRVDSFTGLKERLLHRKVFEKQVSAFGESAVVSVEDEAASISLMASQTPPGPGTGLPRSRETGLMLHQVLERIDFQQVGDAATPESLLINHPSASVIIDTALREQMNLSGSEEILTAKQEAARIIWNTLHAPLNDSSLALRHMDQRLHEVEFYYPVSLPFAGAVPGTSLSNGFIHGFIDMIVWIQKKIYIVDWKSNYIDRGYDRDQLEQNILEMHYDLQISIYTAAVLRWMKRVIPDYSYDRHFGGILYLYLRGMNSEVPGSGIYFVRPDDETTAMASPAFMRGSK